MAKKEYFMVQTSTLIGSGFAGFCALRSGPLTGTWMRPYAEHEARARAEAAADAAFRASGAYPGHRFMAAVVRVDGGRAVVCQSRGRRGW